MLEWLKQNLKHVNKNLDNIENCLGKKQDRNRQSMRRVWWIDYLQIGFQRDTYKNLERPVYGTFKDPTEGGGQIREIIAFNSFLDFIAIKQATKQKNLNLHLGNWKWFGDKQKTKNPKSDGLMFSCAQNFQEYYLVVIDYIHVTDNFTCEPLL